MCIARRPRGVPDDVWDDGDTESDDDDDDYTYYSTSDDDDDASMAADETGDTRNWRYTEFPPEPRIVPSTYTINLLCPSCDIRFCPSWEWCPGCGRRLDPNDDDEL